MVMRKRQVDGTNYLPDLEKKLDHNQQEMVDEVITPHSTKLNEMIDAQHKITASYPAHTDPQMPIRGRGPVVWNSAYEFQPKGPSYLDGSDR
jgi:hypothetical protein